MRLGREPHDPVAVAATPPHVFGSALAPAKVDRTACKVFPGLYNNDTYGDCTCVALTNYARCIAALNGFELTVDAHAPLKLYSNVLDNPPNLQATNGAVALDVLHYQEQNGFDIGPQMLVGRFGRVNLTRNDLALGIDRLGGGYWGVLLRAADMDAATGGSKFWDLTPNDGAVEGGHMINAFDYTGLGDSDMVRVGTWAMWFYATWRWVLNRIEEAYAIAWRQLARTDGTFAFNPGLDADQLIAEA